MEHKPRSTWQILAVLYLFGAAFGFVEATIVVYLRELYEPLARQYYPERGPQDLFPLVTLDQLEAANAPYLRLLKIEVMREAATLAMLASAGLAVGWNFNTRFAGFVIAFGIWDIFYYVFLKVLIHWPASLLDWDLLFLIPLPWVGPVLAPVLVAISMAVAGSIVIGREEADRPVQTSRKHWMTMILGALIIIVAFCWDYRHIMAGGMPRAFPWSIFFVGEVIGLAGFSLAIVRSNTSGRSPFPS